MLLHPTGWIRALLLSHVVEDSIFTGTLILLGKVGILLPPLLFFLIIGECVYMCLLPDPFHSISPHFYLGIC